MLCCVPVTNSVIHRWHYWLLQLFRAAALMLAVAAVVFPLTGGVHVHVGFLTLSATQPARLLVEAVVLLIAAHLLSGLWSVAPATSIVSNRATIPTLLLLFGLLTSLVVDSTARRTGDGGDYMFMAFQMAHGRPPTLSTADLALFRKSLPSHDSLDELQLPGRDLMGSDGRYDFVHFWLYSLLAAPLLYVATLVGAHPNVGFTMLNLLLWGGAGLVLARRVSAALLTLILTGPMVWWLDKAHTELFSVAALTVGVMWIDGQPWWAVLALGIAGTQNPAIAVAALIFAVYAAVRGAGRDRRFLPALVATGVVCALHPAYYVWRLGQLSPLESAVTGQLPGITALLTPLVDPNLGILVYFLAFTALAVAGLVAFAGPRKTAAVSGAIWPAMIAAGLFLFAFAQTPNVNHGGTFNPSRYGLWLIPLGIPLLRLAEDRLGRARSYVMTGLAVFACIWCCYMFAPRWSEHGNDQSTLARLLSTYAPAWYNPLPEVFAERVTGGDERQALPVATPGCTKVLLAGDGTARPAWPIPCLPQDVPAECSRTGALCYANGHPGAYSFSRAPRQAGFSYDPPGGWAWKQTSAPRLRRLIDRLGTGDVEPLPAGKPTSFIAATIHLHGARTWQGARALVAWMAPDPTTKVRIHVPVSGTALWIDDATGEELERVNVAPASDAWLSLPNVPAPVLLICLSPRNAPR